ncbi:hypothetical protein GYMLUDRAFT_74278 [Collybiopsis luxurians FD-317 M1]|uniref:rRNA-processing protein FYV7 n=1 Tax=Collybiopsis luxurians FD-317 M1 TaxID=944289 RepID=A0A0D0CBG0_9AGAR|nr:hypothetical protein GYMLUDRAFT_74278 [Collybiopsis luxurians FD-317 M1]
MVSQVNNSKKPPNFDRYPAQRAKSLKKAWVQNAKIKSKWKAEKLKMGVRASAEKQDVPDTDVKQHPPASTSLNPATSKPSTSTVAASPDLRELARKAYSRESLHNYKSDPLNRRKGANSNGGDRRGRGGSRGRGQPNMKLRMDVMLEKIKRDFT